MADVADEYDSDDASTPIDPTDLKSSRGWLALITKAETAFRTWQDKSDSIDKLYANLETLSSLSRDRQFQLFWANIQVLGPSIYSRPPAPVVVPRFRDQRPIPRIASEMIERCTVVSFETQDLDYVMRQVRDDLNINARGAVWARYETETTGGYLSQKVCVEHVNRRDFLHDPVRNWQEVDWVSKRSWLTKKEARKRFRKTSGDLYKEAAYQTQKDEQTDETDGKLKAGFWELWSKSLNKVVWIAEGCDKVLDEQAPHLELEGFFPCPRPAYGTTQRGSLIPVPDMLLYKDQLEEINQLTGRIHALADALRLKGFYPGGASELADAIEAAVKSNDDTAILVPVANWALFGNGGVKDTIVWIPLAEVGQTISALVTLRKELINDVYQIMGLSDIMRGSTDASETLGAQQLKSQYGSVRIRDKKDELVRIARDVTRITAEIMAENFTQKSMLDMSQMSIPTDAEIAKQAKGIEAQANKIATEIKQAKTDPETQQAAQKNPKAAQQIIQQAAQKVQGMQAEIGKLMKTVTIEQVMKFLRDNRVRCFTLDIETDSTIAPDENEQKQRAAEYVTAISGLLAQLVPAVKEVPQIAPLAADVLKFVNSQFRVGRQFEQSMEEFTDQMKQMAAKPQQKGPTPEQTKAQADAQASTQKGQLDAMKAKGEAAKAQSDAQLEKMQLQLDQQIAKADALMRDKEIELERYKADLKAKTDITTTQIKVGAASDAAALNANLEQEIGMNDQRHEAALQADQHAHEVEQQQTEQAHQQQMQQQTQQAAAAQQAAQPQPPQGAA